MLYHLLDSIKHNPALFLNQHSVTGLSSFLSGWQTAKNIYKIPEDEDESDFDHFQEWVAQRYNIQTSQPWPRIISFFSMDEKESLKLFFKLLEEYRSRPSAQRTPALASEKMILAEAV